MNLRLDVGFLFLLIGLGLDEPIQHPVHIHDLLCGGDSGGDDLRRDLLLNYLSNILRLIQRRQVLSTVNEAQLCLQ